MDLQQTQARSPPGRTQFEDCDSLAFLSKSALSRLSERIWVSIAAGHCFILRASCCGRLDLGAVAPTHLVPKAGRRWGTRVVVRHRKYDDVDSEGHRNPVAFSFYMCS